MARTTEAAVREIIQTGLTTVQVLAFVNDVNLWVTEELAPAGLSASRLEIIERYLACAMIRIRDLGLKDAQIGDVTETYQTDPEVTDYLLRAASFDSTGKVRRDFLAPKPVAAPQPVIFPLIARVGEGFAEEAAESDP
jgi:hypothetical protein